MKHRLTWLFSLSFFLIMSGAQVCFPVEKGHIPVETVTGRITAMNGFVWNYSYDIGQKDNRVVVHVAINLVPADDVTRPELDRVKDKWEAGIERIWSNQFILVTPSGEQYPVVIDAAFDGTRFHHDVIVSRSGGRTDELNWNLMISPEAAAHEFGHMIGAFDEYRGGAVAPGTEMTDRTSIMTGGTDKVSNTYARHFEGIRRWFAEKTGLSGVSLMPIDQVKDAAGSKKDEPSFN